MGSTPTDRVHESFRGATDLGGQPGIVLRGPGYQSALHPRDFKRQPEFRRRESPGDAELLRVCRRPRDQRHRGLGMRIGIDGGFGFWPTTGEVFGVTGIGTLEWNTISVIDSCQVSRAGKHSYSSTGTFATGFTVYRNDMATLGPGAVFSGAWTHFVDFTSQQASGSAYSIYDGCSTINGVSNVAAPGGTDPPASYQSFTAHNDGYYYQFAGRKFINNSFLGSTTLMGGGDTRAVVSANNTFDLISAYFGTWSSTNDTLRTLPPELALNVVANLINPTIIAGSTYVGHLPSLSGVLSITGGTIDMSGANFYSSSWNRAGPVNFRITGTTIKAANNAIFGLVDHWADTDTFTVSGASFIGSPAWGLFGEYNRLPLPNRGNGPETRE